MISQSNDKRLNLIQYSDDQSKSLGSAYKPFEFTFSEDILELLLKIFLFSAKFLKIDKPEIIKKLTEGRDSDEIEFTVREFKNIS